MAGEQHLWEGAAGGWRCVLGCGELSLEQVRFGEFDLGWSGG